MESGKGESSIRWRKRILKPIETKKACKKNNNNNNKEIMITREEEPLSPAARLFHEPSFNLYIIAIIGCKTQIHPQVVKANLVHTLLKHPRFSSLQVDDGETMRWVRTEVDLEKHVIVPELNQNMNSPEEFVEDYVYNLTKSTIDKSQQPLWDLHLLNLKTSSESESVAIFRIHHSLGDGSSLMSLVLACARQINDPEALPTVPVKKKKQQQEIYRGVWGVLMGFLSFCQMFLNSMVDIFMFMATALFLKDTDNPLKGPAGVEFTPRRIVHRTVSLDEMKLVKNAMNATINDVAVGMTQAGLSRYLSRIYGESKEAEGQLTEMKNDLPTNIRLRSTLLINLRPSVGIQAFADMMEKDTEAKYGNWIGYVLLPFNIAIKDDPLDYVREAKAIIDRKKNSLEAIYSFSVAKIVVKLFGIKAASALSHRIIAHTTMCFSNLVGPLEEIGYYGHPMAYLAASSYGQPHALMINFQSYVNKMTIVLSVDEGTIPNPHQLCDDIAESLKFIKDAAGLYIKESKDN